MSDLVIVESPAKAKTIGKYLGPGYQVRATMGHLRDLPKSTLGVDVDNGFSVIYQPIQGKEDTIAELRREAKKADRIFLATDPDREGEAISWHLKELLDLPNDSTYRVTFNEITKRVVRESIENPRDIDINLVDAQQARRVLDRILGYQLSPLLWKKIKRGLSAGRVQSVATRLVVDREEEIRAFNAEEYWTIGVTLSPLTGKSVFQAHFHGNAGAGKRTELKNEGEAQAVVDAVTGQTFTVVDVKNSTKKRSPAPPFITSTLQQEGSRRLGMTAKRTMAVAQQLYEGISVGEMGLTGLITYMRTDSLRLSQEAVDAARNFIQSRYGNNYLPYKPRFYKSRGGAQDAHEAIRPTHVDLHPQDIREELTSDQYKLYKIIYDRFIACQMENAVYDTFTIDSEAAGYLFRANHTTLKFSGFTAVYEEKKDDEAEELTAVLPDLKGGEKLNLNSIEKQQHFTQPPPRYTEATLIRAMEERGIGRPSTYAPTLSTISDREYVLKEGKSLRPTPLGEVVTSLMKDRFKDIIDVEFTAHMETDLDRIEEGKIQWKNMLADFYKDFSQTLKAAEQDTERIKIPDEKTDQVCDLCGSEMVIKMGRFGRFLACSAYPECKNTKPIAEEMPGRCPNCDGKIFKKKSKKGYAYYGCEKGAACGFMSWDVPQKENCPLCGKTMFKKSGKGSKKIFCQNSACENFVPEEERGYKKKPSQTASEGEEAEKTHEKKPAVKKAPAKKTTDKKAPAKTAAAEKADATKKTSSKSKEKKL